MRIFEAFCEQETEIWQRRPISYKARMSNETRQTTAKCQARQIKLVSVKNRNKVDR